MIGASIVALVGQNKPSDFRNHCVPRPPPIRLAKRDSKTFRASVELRIHPAIYDLGRKIWGRIPDSSLKRKINVWRMRRMLSVSAFTDYHAWRKARIEARSQTYHVEGARLLFSINTTVYDTPAKYLRDLRQCIVAQDYPYFEWNILDNGSRQSETIEAIRDIAASDGRFRTWRVEDNLHIIGGNRFLLERSNNDYIIPIDSDDLLDPDSLRVVACYIFRLDFPDMLYSDEEKTDSRGVGIGPILRHAPSLLVGYSHCFFAHLSCFGRAMALEVGVYTQDYARGSHDWDTYHRFAHRGARMVHVPEVLYGWRMSGSSTAQDVGSKSFVIDSQRQVLEQSLARRGRGHLFDIVGDERRGECFWKAVRRQVEAPTIEIVFRTSRGNWARESFDKLRQAMIASQYPADRLHVSVIDPTNALAGEPIDGLAVEIHRASRASRLEAINGALQRSAAQLAVVIDEHVYPQTPTWLWDVAGMFDLDDKLAALSGLVVNRHGRIVTMPRLAGLDGHAAMPYIGLPFADAFRLTARYALDQNCSAIAMPWVALHRQRFCDVGGFRRDFIGSGGDVEFCFRAIRAGWTIGFTGRVIFNSLNTDPDYGPNPSSRFFKQMLAEYLDLFWDDPFYYPAMSLKSNSFGMLESVESRQAVLAKMLDANPATRGLVQPGNGRTVQYDLRHRLNPRQR